MDTDPFQEFAAEVEKYPGMWGLIQLDGLAAHCEGTWHILGLQAMLALPPEEQNIGSEVLFEISDTVVVVRHTRPASDAHSLLREIQRGEIVLGQLEVCLDAFTHFRCVKFSAEKGWHKIVYPYVLLNSHGKSVAEVIDTSALNRRLAPYGYETLESLARETMGFPVGDAYSATLNFIMPILVEATANFVGDNLVVRLRCRSTLRPEDFKGAYECRTVSDTLRSPFALGTKDVIERADDFYVMEKVFEFAPEVLSARIRVWHETQPDPLYATLIVKPAPPEMNPIFFALKVLLSSQRRQGQLLDAGQFLKEAVGIPGAPRQARLFEPVVANLMTSAGYFCLFTGGPLRLEGVDALAFDPELRYALAISMTTSASRISDKIQSLLEQRNALSHVLKDIEIIAGVVVPSTLDDVVQSARSDADAHGIALVLLPELERILDVLSTSALGEARTAIKSVFKGGRALM